MKGYVFDWDDVLADTINAVAAWHNQVYGTSLRREDFTSYRFWEVWGGTKQETIEKMNRFTNTPYFQGIQRYPGADLVFRLEGRLYVATSRPTWSRRQTEDQVERLYPSIFSDVIFSGEFFDNGQETKPQICDRLNAGVFVDDQPHFCESCRSPGRDVLLLDSPWNRGIETEGVTRVFGWEGIGARL